MVASVFPESSTESSSLRGFLTPSKRRGTDALAHALCLQIRPAGGAEARALRAKIEDHGLIAHVLLHDTGFCEKMRAGLSLNEMKSMALASWVRDLPLSCIAQLLYCPIHQAPVRMPGNTPASSQPWERGSWSPPEGTNTPNKVRRILSTPT